MLLAIIGGVLYLVLTEGVRKQVAPEEEQRHMWAERIRFLGGIEAYSQFSKSVFGETLNAQHEQAHVFGRALYETEGLPALSVCDDRFLYGCFHEFVGTAIADLGIGAVEKLNDACTKALGADAGFCQHGVGHGIQTHYGYTPAHVKDALALCATLPNNDPIGGCAGGIFMEYNMRTMLAEDAVLRPFSHEEMFEPCRSLDAQYKEACAYWQTQWWHEAQLDAKQSPDVFRQLGTQCRDMFKNDVLVRRCLEGIGNLMPSFEGVAYEDARVLCEVASHDDDALTQACQSAFLGRLDVVELDQ